MTPTRFRECCAQMDWAYRHLGRRLGRSEGNIRQWARGDVAIPPEVDSWLESVVSWVEKNPAPQRIKSTIIRLSAMAVISIFVGGYAMAQEPGPIGFEAGLNITSGSHSVLIGKIYFLTQAQQEQFLAGEMTEARKDAYAEAAYQRRKAATGFDGGWIIDDRPETWVPPEKK